MTAITQAVQIRVADMTVINKFFYDNQATIDFDQARLGPLFKLIGDDNWNPTSKIPEVGDIWDNQLPASFAVDSVAQPDPVPGKPTSLAEAQAIVLQRQSEADAAGQVKAAADAAEREAQADLAALIPTNSGA